MPVEYYVKEVNQLINQCTHESKQKEYFAVLNIACFSITYVMPRKCHIR